MRSHPLPPCLPQFYVTPSRVVGSDTARHAVLVYAPRFCIVLVLFTCICLRLLSNASDAFRCYLPRVPGYMPVLFYHRLAPPVGYRPPRAAPHTAVCCYTQLPLVYVAPTFCLGYNSRGYALPSLAIPRDLPGCLVTYTTTRHTAVIPPTSCYLPDMTFGSNMWHLVVP